MDDAVRLQQVESIKQLKARYCRHLDAKAWGEWRALFTDDFIGDTTGAGGRVISGADEFVAYSRNTLGKAAQVTVHQVHAPEIELTSATTARGIWALNDVVQLIPALTLHGYGHYHETYEKTVDGWRIKTSTLTRLREDITVRLLPPSVARRLRALAAKRARRSAIADQGSGA